jgi:hypothetical protein
MQSSRISILRKIPNGFQSLQFDTLTLSPTRVNWVERWSNAWVISIKGPMMWVSFDRDGKTELGAHMMVSKRNQ